MNMSDRDQQLLRDHVERVAETVREYVRQIESGEYGDEWVVQSFTHPVDGRTTVNANSEELAISRAFWNLRALGIESGDDLAAERVQADEPTVDETSIYEYPLAVIDERGRPFEVQICTGGPGISVEAEGLYSARLEGYWGGSRVTLHGDEFSAFLDYFIDRDEA